MGIDIVPGLQLKGKLLSSYMVGELVNFVEYVERNSPHGQKRLIPIRKITDGKICYLAVSLAKDLCYKDGNNSRIIKDVIDSFEFTDEALALFSEYQQGKASQAEGSAEARVHHEVQNSREFLLHLVEGATSPAEKAPYIPATLRKPEIIRMTHFDTDFRVEVADMEGKSAEFIAELYYDSIESAYMVACSTLKKQNKRAKKIRIKGYIINNAQVYKPLQLELNAFDYDFNYTRTAQNDSPFREIVIYKAME